MSSTTPAQWLDRSELIYPASVVHAAIVRIAEELVAKLDGKSVVVLCVMRGGLYFAGQLIPLLPFALQLDYVQANRYHGTMGEDVVWSKTPELSLEGQTVLILDDILDAGLTLAEIKQYCHAQGAVEVMVAVLTEKDNSMQKPVMADFIGLTVPDRYVFGCGMDVYGWWRNLPEIRALV